MKLPKLYVAAALVTRLILTEMPLDVNHFHMVAINDIKFLILLTLAINAADVVSR